MIDSFSAESGGLSNSRILLNIMCRQARGLRFCHINAQSIYPKIDEFRDVFNGSLLDVICISETWLKPDVGPDLVALPKFRVFRNDRVGRVGGGVAMFVRDSLRARVVARSEDAVIEYIFIEVIVNSVKCLVGTVYKPPNVTDFSSLEIVFSNLSHAYPHIIITGDFNVDLLRSSSIARCFSNMLNTHSLSVFNSFPTHFTSTSATLLDLLIVANLEHILFFNQISMSCFSKHDLILGIYDLPIQSDREQAFTYRDYNNINSAGMLVEAEDMNWNLVYSLTSVDDQLLHLTSLISYLHDNYVPLKRRRVPNPQCPWFTNGIRELISRRNIAYRRWKRFRTPQCWELFRVLRNSVNREITRSKLQFYNSKFNTSLPTKQLWRNLSSIGVGKSMNSVIDADANVLNRAFTAHTGNSIVRSNNLHFFDDANFDGFAFAATTEMEVFSAVMSIGSNAVGLDGLHPSLIKILLPVILPSLTHLFNSIIMSSTFPVAWKFSKVLPINKRTPGVVEYRPISILPFCAKAFEKILHRQISSYLKNGNLLSDLQSGFRPKRSCTTTLLKITDDIRVSLDKDNFTALTLLDFSKAFDRVNHIILLHKLRSIFSFSSSACRMIWSYLSGRLQRVLCNGTASDFLPVHSGVPQGSTLGPLLFAIFINDLPSVLRNCECHLYADDVQLYISRPLGLVEDAICRMNEDLVLVSKWAHDNDFLLNPSKSSSIIIYRTELDTSSFPCVMLDNVVIPFRDTLKNLGLVFNKTLSWCNHVNSLVGKVYTTLRKLSLSAAFTPLETRIMLVKTLIVPLLSYGCEVFCGLDSLSARKLNVAFNSAVRYAFCLRRYDHVSAYASSILGCSFDNYMKFRTVMFLRNLILSTEPCYLYCKLLFSQSNRTCSLTMPRFNFLSSERQFFVQSTRLWNSLPLELRSISSNRNFRIKLFQYFSL